ncbi:tryptophan halogenase family protein [Asticcacaulis sp.]|uniref:tryptophan halogenase family protein n=1 Tax=Asticcacaulis sp. TaxID=1872648 RepID=UPI002CEBD08A|nr:tryptophan halogenase family protein [Asticcacaulis sp.]HTM81547.1 tryptophan halogenase family protein [Asticcacaulis sp.]
MTPQFVNKVVIAGRDAACWLTANALLQAFGPTGLAVEVVELPSRLSPHDVYATLPALEAFHSMLGLNEYEIMKTASGAYSLGQSFANFSPSGPAFFHPYGAHGKALDRLPFIQLWLRAHHSGMKVDFEDFSFNAAAAKLGRFFIPNDQTDMFARSDYAYHLKAAPYVQSLKSTALRRGASVRTSRHIEAIRNDQTGEIAALNLSDGSQVSGDLFIDATGPDSLLLGGAQNVGVESWRTWFGCNRIITASAAALRPLPPYSQVRALKSGCLHIAPLQDMTGLTFAFDSTLASDDEALNIAAMASQLRLRADAVADTLEPGRRSVAWAGNVVAIGESAANFDPIDSLGLHAIHQSLVHLIGLFPVNGSEGTERDEYNRIMASHFERLRDFQISHFKLNQKVGDAFWDAARTEPPPSHLAHKIEMFKARALMPMYDDETFEIDSWLSSFLGHGLTPEAYDPLVEMLPDDQLIPLFQRMLGYIKDQVQDMTSHDAYLELHASKNYA